MSIIDDDRVQGRNVGHVSLATRRMASSDDMMILAIQHTQPDLALKFSMIDFKDWFSFKLILRPDGTIYFNHNYYGNDFGIGYDTESDELRVMSSDDERVVNWNCDKPIDPQYLN